MKKVVVRDGNKYRKKNLLELKDWTLLCFAMLVLDFIVLQILRG